MNIFAVFTQHVRAAVSALASDGIVLPEASLDRIVVEAPRDPTHGDLATNAAMVLSKDAGLKPRDLAEKIAARLSALADVVRVDIAGPGFINLKVAASIWPKVLKAAVAEGEAFGRASMGGGAKVNVEYVSANPTGPMHVGHCRGAVFGDALANLLACRRLRRDPRILHQRCRRAGRRARPLGLSALPRGARRDHHHPRGALSR
jgi:arginyl-tRNA synthetase